MTCSGYVSGSGSELPPLCRILDELGGSEQIGDAAQPNKNVTLAAPPVAAPPVATAEANFETTFALKKKTCYSPSLRRWRDWRSGLSSGGFSPFRKGGDKEALFLSSADKETSFHLEGGTRLRSPSFLLSWDLAAEDKTKGVNRLRQSFMLSCEDLCDLAEEEEEKKVTSDEDSSTSDSDEAQLDAFADVPCAAVEHQSEQRPMPRRSRRSSGWVMLQEDADLHEYWAEIMDGRRAEALGAGEVRALVRSGMPMKFRFALWPHWCTKYVGCLRGLDAQRNELDETVVQAIAKDIPRTMPNALDDAQRDNLRLLLECYAIRNPSIGYCQGMSFLLYVFLVLGFENDHAFAGLCVLMEDVCPGYHDVSLEGYFRDVQVVELLLQQHVPDVCSLLDIHDVPLNLLAIDHFLCLSACRWPIGAVVRLYDLVLMEGTPAVFASLLALLKLFFSDAVKKVERDTGELNRSDIMAQFAQDVLAGVKTDIASVLRLTHSFLRLFSADTLTHLRQTVVQTRTK